MIDIGSVEVPVVTLSLWSDCRTPPGKVRWGTRSHRCMVDFHPQRCVVCCVVVFTFVIITTLSVSVVYYFAEEDKKEKKNHSSSHRPANNNNNVDF